MANPMVHSFSQIPAPQIERSTFDLSHPYKTTFDAGYLIPIFKALALPGDTWNVHMNGFARLATPIKPIMDNLRMTSFFFAVPIRQIWDHFKEFMGEQPDPDNDFSNPEYYIPQMTAPDHAAGGIAVGSLSDYLGLPVGEGDASNTGVTFNSWFHRSYNWIWNSWFRDESLQSRAVVDIDDGPDSYSDYFLLRRGKSKDMVTGSLPYVQKGADVLLPLGSTAPVIGIGKYNDSFTGTGTSVIETTGSNTYGYSSTINATNEGTWFIKGSAATGHPEIWADLANATAATINALRQAWQIQRLYEAEARSGTRYYELMQGIFKVRDPGMLVQQLPLYLGGGGSSMVNVHPIAQTSASPTTPTDKNAQGNLAGFGTASVSGHGFQHSFTEHCILLGLICVDADLTYQNRLDRFYTIQTRYDMYYPQFAHLGEQAILKQEVNWTGKAADDTAVFGYNERFIEYRTMLGEVTGLFRSQAASSLDVWHLAQDFGATAPTLNAAFIQSDPPIDRVIAVPSEPHFIFDSWFNIKATRPLPVFSIPGLVDHF